MGKINVDGKVLNGGFNFLVNEIKKIMDTIKCMYRPSIINNFYDVIVMYTQGNGFRLYIIMQGMTTHKYFYKYSWMTHALKHQK